MIKTIFILILNIFNYMTKLTFSGTGRVFPESDDTTIYRLLNKLFLCNWLDQQLIYAFYNITYSVFN